MTPYIKSLGGLVLGTFATSFLGYLLLAQPFDVLTFEWKAALIGSASAAFLALVKGLAAKRVGDPETPYFTGRPPID